LRRGVALGSGASPVAGCCLADEVEEVAEILSFSPRWVRTLLKRYNEGGAEALGDQRIHNGTKPTILTPEALAAPKERIKAPPDDGGLWSGPKIARGLAKFHGMRSVHDQRGWDALIAIGYSIQQPRPRHPDAATEEDRAALKKSLKAAVDEERREHPGASVEIWAMDACMARRPSSSRLGMDSRSQFGPYVAVRSGFNYERRS
jgi:transposase